MLRAIIISTIYNNPPKHYLENNKDNKIAIVLIPGIFEKWSYVKNLGDTISRVGYPVYIAPSLRYNLFNIPLSAEILHSTILKNEISKNSEIIFVAYSKGGLIGKYFMTHHNKDNKILGMVTISTPFSGSNIVKYIPLDPFTELNTNSKIIHELNKEKSINQKIISIYPKYDNS